jgi:hypothetical protein
MGGKSSQTQQVQSIPPDVLARYNAVNAKAEQVAATPFQQYSSDPSGFVAPLNPVQTGAIQKTQEYANLAQPYYNLGTGLTLAGAGAANPEQLDIGQYMSPYLGSVVGSTLANLQQQQQQEQSALKGTAIGAGAFGGDRSGIAQANLARQQELATGQTVSGILNQGYGQALSTAQQQQGVNLGAQQANLARFAQAGQGIAGLGAGAQQAGLSGAQAQLAAGTAPQQTQQAGLSALYNQFLQQQGYPFQTTQFLANIAEGTGALSGGTTASTQPSSFFSDERLKENIETIGHTHDGMKIIKFNYKGHPEKQIGFSAQDVEKHHPEAVGESQGYKTVDYDKATQQSAHLGHHKDSMGGSVHEGHAGEGYAKGGLTTDDIIKQIMLASQKTMPYGGIGLYGNPNFNRSGAYDTSQADLQMGFRKGPPGPAGLRPSDYVAPVAFASGGVVPHMADGGIPDYLTIMQQAYGNSPWAKAIGAVGGGLGIPTQAPAARSLPKPSALPAQRKSGLQETAGLGMQGLEGYKTYTDIQKNLADADKKGKGLAPIKPANEDIMTNDQRKTANKIFASDAPPPPLNDTEGKPSITPDDYGPFTSPTDSELGFGLGTGEYRGGLVRHHYGAGGLPYNTDDPYVPAEDTEQKPPQKLQNPQEIAKKAAGNPIMGGLGGAALTAALTSNPWLIGAAGLMGALSQSKRGGLITGHPHYAEGGLAPRHGYAKDGAVEDESVDPIQAANDEISPDQLAEAQNVFTDVAPPAAKPAAFDVGRKADQGSDPRPEDAERNAAIKTAIETINQNNPPPSGTDDVRSAATAAVPRLASLGTSTPRPEIGGVAPPVDQGTGSAAPVGDRKTISGIRDVNYEPYNRTERTLLPILMGLGTMVESPSRYLGSALFSGVKGGAKAYGEMQKEMSEAGKASQRIGVEQQGADTQTMQGTLQILDKLRQTAGSYASRGQPVPLSLQKQIESLFKITTDIANRTVPGSASNAADTSGTISVPPPASVQKSAYPQEFLNKLDPMNNPQNLRKLAVETAFYDPAAADKLNTEALRIEDQLRSTGKAIGKNGEVVDVPGWRSSQVENVASNTEIELAANILKNQREKSTTAFGTTYRLNEMDKAFDTLPAKGFLTPGSYATERADFAKAANTAVTALGGQAIFDPTQVSSIESLMKDTKRLGFELSNTMGREPGFIVNQSITANPGIENTPQGYKRLSAGLKQAAQYEKDRTEFYDNWFIKNRNLNGAETAFAKSNPPQKYVENAILSTVGPNAREHLLGYMTTNPKDTYGIAARKAGIDEKYGKGVADLLIKRGS